MGVNGTPNSTPKVKNLQTRVNPIQLQRIRTTDPVTGNIMTQERLAAVASVSKPLIMRIEQGLISSVSYQILRALWPLPEEQARALDAYEEWRKETRRKNIVYFQNRIDYPNSFNGSWVSFRSSIHPTKIGFCKLYCIHPQVLDNFEKRHLVSNRRGLSPYMREVFISAGNEYIEALEERMRFYADTHEDINRQDTGKEGIGRQSIGRGHSNAS